MAPVSDVGLDNPAQGYSHEITIVVPQASSVETSLFVSHSVYGGDVHLAKHSMQADASEWYQQ